MHAVSWRIETVFVGPCVRCGWHRLNEARLTAYVGAIVALAAALCASWTYWYGVPVGPRFVVGATIFAGFLVLGETFSARINEHLTISASDVGLIVAVAVLGPFWAAVAVVPADLLAGRKSWLRLAYEMGHSISIVYLAGLVFSLSSEPLLVGNPQPSADLFYGTLVAGLTLVAANGMLHGILLKVKYDQSFYENWSENVQPYLVSNVLDVLTAGLGLLFLAAYGPLAAVVAVAGSVGSQALVYYSRGQTREIGELRERNRSLEETLATSNTTFGTMMVQELGRKDGYTHRHAAATAVYAADLAREMKLDEARVERVRLAGLLHNIGLFGLPEELLLSTGKVNSLAWNQITKHPVRGEKVLAAVSEYREMASWVRWHHERPDGRGYPDKLRGAWIPLEAKILCLSQAYAAMVLDQPRRPALAQAREELSVNADKQFDGVLVRALLRILDTETEGYRMADDYRFAFPEAGDRERRARQVPEDGVRGSGRTAFP